MWARLEPWQMPQLQRLAKLAPQRVESLFNTLWIQYPGLYEALAIAAVDQEMLSVEACADLLQVPTWVVEEKLIQDRRSTVSIESAVVHDDSHKNVARLANGQVGVWEVVREYRTMGSVEQLRGLFAECAKLDDDPDRILNELNRLPAR